MIYKDILTKEYLIEHYINQEKSSEKIAKELDIKCHVTVINYIKKFGLKREPLHNRHKKILTKEFLEENYIRQNKTLLDIAQSIGYNRESIIKTALEEHRIPIRNITYSKVKIEAWEKQKSHHTISGELLATIKRGARDRNLEFLVSIEYLWQLFEKQQGKCALSGINIEFKKFGYKIDRKTQTASLDRIDSSKGYIEGNVQWVHKRINRMKGNMTDEQFIGWCQKVVNNNK